MKFDYYKTNDHYESPPVFAIDCFYCRPTEKYKAKHEWAKNRAYFILTLFRMSYIFSIERK